MRDRQQSDLAMKIKQLEYEIEELTDRLSQSEKLLEDIYRSKTWKLGQLYGRLIGVESVLRKRFVSFIGKVGLFPKSQSPAQAGAVPIVVTSEYYSMVEDFISGCDVSTGVFIIISGIAIANRITSRTDQLSHRAVRLAKEFAAKGYSAFFVVTQQRGGLRDAPIERVDNNILQMHISVFRKMYHFIFSKLSIFEKQRILLVQSLHPVLVEVLGHANADRWTTVYDCLDNWEEFFNQGWHSWYDRRVEEFVFNNVDHRITVSPFLREKFQDYEPIHIVHNGYSPNIANDFVKELKKGEITIGYMGNLQKFRFDWEFLSAVAERRKEWIFYLLGLLPPGISFPDNIIHLPPVKPQFLCAYARNWDVAVIPFKINALTLACDNLKIYEYLLFRLPVVGRGVGEHAGHYPYVYLAETEESFIRSIELAAATKMEERVIVPFLETCDWTSRARDFLRILQSEQRNYKDVLFESPLHS